jgi:hypothetical protein
MNRYDDAHYRQWPFPLTDQEVAESGYLQSLTPLEELAVFLVIRGACWQANGRLRKAHEAFAEAARLVPRCLLYQELAAGMTPGIAPRVGMPTTAAAPVHAARTWPDDVSKPPLPPGPRLLPHLDPNPLHQLSSPKH